VNIANHFLKLISSETEHAIFPIEKYMGGKSCRCNKKVNRKITKKRKKEKVAKQNKTLK